MAYVRDIFVTEDKFYQHIDTIEYIHNKWGHFWDTIEDKFLPKISGSYDGKRWVVTLNPDGTEGEMVFGDGINPGVTKAEYDTWVKSLSMEIWSGT